jgi:hypothetical protein
LKIQISRHVNEDDLRPSKGIEDKKYSAQTYGKELGKASVTGYCIRFKSPKDINVELLEAAIRLGVRGPEQKAGLVN